MKKRKTTCTRNSTRPVCQRSEKTTKIKIAITSVEFSRDAESRAVWSRKSIQNNNRPFYSSPRITWQQHYTVRCSAARESGFGKSKQKGLKIKQDIKLPKAPFLNGMETIRKIKHKIGGRVGAGKLYNLLSVTSVRTFEIRWWREICLINLFFWRQCSVQRRSPLGKCTMYIKIVSFFLANHLSGWRYWF